MAILTNPIDYSQTSPISQGHDLGAEFEPTPLDRAWASGYWLGKAGFAATAGDDCSPAEASSFDLGNLAGLADGGTEGGAR